MRMKGTPLDDLLCSVELLEGDAAVRDVIDKHICNQNLAEKNAFFVADLGAVVRQQIRWRSHLDQVRPFYLVKCNSSSVVIEVLAALGTGFICSSKSELELVRSFGVSSQDIILGGMCKQLSLIKFAAKLGVQLLMCDSEAELRKIARCHGNAKVLLQVSTEVCCDREETSMQFGLTLKDCRHLLEFAKELHLQVSGVRFHIPSCCADLQTFSHAVSDARCVFDMGEELGFVMNILDIGGGFDGTEAQLEKVNWAMKPMLDVYFPPASGVSIMAEPGAYYVSAAFSLAVNIISKKILCRDSSLHPDDELCGNEEAEFQYYMNDGVYGSFSYKLLNESVPIPSLHKEIPVETPRFSSSLWGPSGDDLDQVLESCVLPELSVGDWLIFSPAGACSPGATGPLGDQHRSPVHYIISAGAWYEIQTCGITLDSTVKRFCVIPQPSLTQTSVSTPA